MMVTFNEGEIAHIIADYAKRELNHEIDSESVFINIEGEGDEQKVTASYEIEQFPETAEQSR